MKAQTTQNNEAAAIGADTAAQQQTTRPDSFELQVIEAVQKELINVRTQVYALEMKVSRYERAFETMFREELERRVGSKSGLAGMDTVGCEISPLERLKYQSELSQRNRL